MIMKSSKELKEERNDILKKMDALVSTAKTEKRELTEEQKKEFDQYEARAESMIDDIKRSEKIEARQAEKAKAEFIIGNNAPNKEGEKGEERNIAKRYRLVKAIQKRMNGGQLDGVELEMHTRAEEEAKENGVSLSGIGVPYFLRENRDLIAGTANVGGDTIATELSDIIPSLRPELQTQMLGARVFSGLTSNIDFLRQAGVTTAVWEGEQDANAESNPTFSKDAFTPNRLGAKTHFSKALLNQSSIDIERFVRDELRLATGISLDSAAINGSGVGSIPTGVLNTSGIGDVAGGTNGLAPTHDHIIDLESAISTQNGMMANMAYFTTPGVRGKLKKTKVDAGSGQFVWGQDAQTLNGYNTAVSTQMPSDLTKGTSSGVCHAIIFGDWSNLFIGNWGPYDVVLDPYTLADTATVRIIVNSWWDVYVRQAASFAAMKDALIS